MAAARESRREPFLDAYWSNVDVRGVNDCWPWTGFITLQGYGKFFYAGRRLVAHRVAWGLGYASDSPADLDVDHVCHNSDESCPGGFDCPHRRCQNPAHLQVKSTAENVMAGHGFGRANAAKTHCPKGHPYDEENTYQRGRWRQCRACHREAEARRRAAK